jgi:chromosome segregation ATPase
VKVTVIALGLLLVGSLATSGYLLIERKANVQKITEAQGETKKVRKTNLDLTEEKTQAQKSFYEAKANLTIASNIVTQALEEIESLETKSASELADIQSKLSAADDKETTLNGELLTRDEKITQLAADHNATQTKLQAAEEQLAARLTEIQAREADLTKSVEALKPFLATGLSAEEIAQLKEKRPVDLPKPVLLAPTPIRPGKLTQPLTHTPKDLTPPLPIPNLD